MSDDTPSRRASTSVARCAFTHLVIALCLVPQLPVACIVSAATATPGQATRQPGDAQMIPIAASNTGATRIRVLLMNNSEKQRAIEEGAALSLDPPTDVGGLEAPASSRSSGAKPEVKPDEQSVVEQSSSKHNDTLSFRRTTLASLTLLQRHQRQSRADGANFVDSNSPSTNSISSSQQQQVKSASDPWAELYLARSKPSWLDVSSQFKISQSSISEIQSSIPSEWVLRAAFDSPILLRTRIGIFEGVRSIKFNKFLYTFLSVPYAKPPVGDLRFMPPQEVPRWEGIYQATKWPPFCVQPSMTLATRSSPVHLLSQMMTEDCLYLNIWTPSLKKNKDRKRPVMIWIHGGAFQYGGTSVDENDGSALALLGDVVVITFNYRISAFGFLNANNPKNAPNNVGLLDQRAAMKWVKDNIDQFGGDPDQITLFGESAGGHSVGFHMISPGSQALFRRAILQSGVPTSLLRSYDVNPDNQGPHVGQGVSSVMLAKRLKCYVEFTSDESTTTTEQPETTTTVEGASIDEEDTVILDDSTIDCLRNKSSLEILKAMGAPGNAGFFPTGQDIKGMFSNGPVMSSFDPDNLKIGPQKDYLIGTNTDEGTFMLHYGMPSLFPARDVPRIADMDALKKAIRDEIEKRDKAPPESENKTDIESASGSHGGAQAHLFRPLLRLGSTIVSSLMSKSKGGNLTYHEKAFEFGRGIGHLITDIIFLCPSRTLAKTLSEAGRNVYFYLYTHRSSKSPYHEWLGVTHHDEVEFVFGRPLRMADVYTGKDIEMSQRMIKMWTHFAHTGKMPDQFGQPWPTYGVEDHNYMSLASDNATLGQRYHDKFCNIYESVIAVHIQDA